MDESEAAGGTLSATSKQIARRLLSIVDNRLELLTVEVQEERERFLHALLLALGMAAFGLLAGLSFTAAMVLLFWWYSPLCILLVMAGLYAAAGLYMSRVLIRLRREWHSLSGSLDQFRKDRAGLGFSADLGPRERDKDSLLAESERNRAQLLGDLEGLHRGVQARLAAGVIGATVAAFRRGSRAATPGRQHWLATLLKVAVRISSIWLTFRSGQRHRSRE